MPDGGWDAALSWLHTQLDEDERVAQATILKLNGGRGEWTRHGMEVRDDRGHLIVKHTWPNEGDHIIRHDPAAILRRVETDRRILAHVAEELADAGGDNPWWYADRLTPIVKAFAQRYAHLPDFPEVLRPDQAETSR